jgi:hypothetical protein
MEVLNKINEQLEAFKAKRAELVKELQTEFPSLLLPLLSQSNKIESIGWRQYTPYFNDGDECVFGVYYDDLTINGIDEYDDDEKEIEFIRKRIWNGDSWVENPNLDTHEYSLLKQIEEVLKGVPDDFYKDLFGDHVTVTVYKDGRIETEKYDHD